MNGETRDFNTVIAKTSALSLCIWRNVQGDEEVGAGSWDGSLSWGSSSRLRGSQSPAGTLHHPKGSSSSACFNRGQLLATALPHF